jgi:RNA polymerase sigma-70 factor, ECF subfamily
VNPPVDWAELVTAIRSGDDAAGNELYKIFEGGIRFYLCRQLGSQDLDDRVHDTFVMVLQQIRRGDLREPERLMGFVRTITRRAVAGYIKQRVEVRRRDVSVEYSLPIVDARTETPEQLAIAKQQRELAVTTLEGMNARYREILTRFYLHEQRAEEICAEMGLTDTQFRLCKSRAKAQFSELAQRRLRKNLPLAA